MTIAASLMIAGVAMLVAATPRWSVEPASFTGHDPAARTSPLVTLDCKVADRSRRWQQIRLRISGGQGFFQEPDFPGSSYVRVTTRMLEVVEDKRGIFRGYARSGKYDLSSAKLAGPDYGKIALKFDPYDTFEIVTIAREHPTDYAAPPVAIHTGFCKAIETPQPPLTRAQTDDLLTQCPKAFCK